MTYARTLLGVTVLVLYGTPAFAESFSFESGDLAGWDSTSAGVTAVGGVWLPPGLDLFEVKPTDGSYQALLSSEGVGVEILESFFGMGTGTLADQGYVQGSGLARTVTLNAGDKLSFDWDFVAGDLFPFDDAALFVLDKIGTVLANISLVGDFGSTGYLTQEFVAKATGDYRIGVGVFDAFDPAAPSFLAVDNFNVTRIDPLPGPDPTPVPEPATLVLFAVGATIACARRSRR
jgi:hypothetical protein